MKNASIYEWILLILALGAAAALLMCCDPCPVTTETAARCGQLCQGQWSEDGCCVCDEQPCPADRTMNDGTCCPEGQQATWVPDLPNEEMFQVCEPTGLGQPCDPTSGWQDLYPDLCCRDDVIVTCEVESIACDPTSGWWIDFPEACCIDGFVTDCGAVAP